MCLLSAYILQCTATCGQGYQMRAVKCVNELLSAVLDDRMCHGASRPNGRQVKDISLWIINKRIYDIEGLLMCLKLFPYVFFPCGLKNVCVLMYMRNNLLFLVLPAT